MINMIDAARAVIRSLDKGETPAKADVDALREEVPQMKEGQSDHDGIQLIGSDSYLAVLQHHTDKAEPDFIGTLTEHDGLWYATMGCCIVGRYRDRNRAIDNIIVAYYG